MFPFDSLEKLEGDIAKVTEDNEELAIIAVDLEEIIIAFKSANQLTPFECGDDLLSPLKLDFEACPESAKVKAIGLMKRLATITKSQPLIHFA